MSVLRVPNSDEFEDARRHESFRWSPSHGPVPWHAHRGAALAAAGTGPARRALVDFTTRLQDFAEQNEYNNRAIDYDEVIDYDLLDELRDRIDHCLSNFLTSPTAEAEYVAEYVAYVCKIAAAEAPSHLDENQRHALATMDQDPRLRADALMAFWCVEGARRVISAVHAFPITESCTEDTKSAFLDVCSNTFTLNPSSHLPQFNDAMLPVALAAMLQMQPLSFCDHTSHNIIGEYEDIYEDIYAGGTNHRPLCVRLEQCAAEYIMHQLERQQPSARISFLAHPRLVHTGSVHPMRYRTLFESAATTLRRTALRPLQEFALIRASGLFYQLHHNGIFPGRPDLCVPLDLVETIVSFLLPPLHGVSVHVPVEASTNGSAVCLSRKCCLARVNEHIRRHTHLACHTVRETQLNTRSDTIRSTCADATLIAVLPLVLYEGQAPHRLSLVLCDGRPSLVMCEGQAPHRLSLVVYGGSPSLVMCEGQAPRRLSLVLYDVRPSLVLDEGPTTPPPLACFG